MWEWLKHHAGVVPCELDTVIGSISGGRCGGLFPGDTIVNDTFKVITASLIAPLWGVV